MAYRPSFALYLVLPSAKQCKTASRTALLIAVKLPYSPSCREGVFSESHLQPVAKVYEIARVFGLIAEYHA